MRKAEIIVQRALVLTWLIFVASVIAVGVSTDLRQKIGVELVFAIFVVATLCSMLYASYLVVRRLMSNKH